MERVLGHVLPADEDTDLRDIPFRSLHFSELALRIEDDLDRELNFEAMTQRRVQTVGDVLDAMMEMVRK
jgi:acyl carrier protein